MALNQGVKYFFVINPGSGSDGAEECLQDIKEHFGEKTDDYAIYLLDSKAKFDALKDEIQQRKPTCVAAAGGDGTINFVANLIAHTDICLGILPQGSANGMAKELGIPDDMPSALKILTEAEVHPCDLIQFNNDKYCLHLSDVGLNAHLIKYFDEGEMRGFAGYAKVVLRTLWNKRRMQARIETQNAFVTRSAFMIAFANARMYGNGALLNPEGLLDDGIFEMIIVRKLNFWAIAQVMFKTGLFDPQKIEIIRAKSAEIKMSKRMHFQIDGEYMGKVTDVTAKICKHAINIIYEKTPATP